MRRLLIRSATFARALRRYHKMHHEVAASLPAVFDQIAEDAFEPLLRTHKLRGTLAGFWSSSVGYNSPIVFKFVQHENSEAILLQSIGMHDDVY